jgi:hypothetical protein
VVDVMVSSGFSLGAALKAGLGFIPRGLGAAWLVLGVTWGLSVLASENVIPLLGLDAGVAPFIFIALFGVSLMAEGALYRKALFGSYAKAEGLGWGGLQFAKPELRLLGATLLIGVFIIFIGMVFAVVIAIGLNAAGMITPAMNLPHDLLRYHGTGTIAVIAALVFCAVFFVYLVFRLSLFKAATIASHQVVSLNALGFSGGQSFKLFLGVFTLSLPVIAITAFFTSSYMQLAWGGAFVGAKSFSATSLIPQAALKAIAIGLVMPALCGFFSSAYRQTLASQGKEGA